MKMTDGFVFADNLPQVWISFRQGRRLFFFSFFSSLCGSDGHSQTIWFLAGKMEEGGGIRVRKPQHEFFHLLAEALSLKSFLINAHVFVLNPFCGKTK